MKHLTPIFALITAMLIVFIPAGCTTTGTVPEIQLPNPLQPSEQCNADLDNLPPAYKGNR